MTARPILFSAPMVRALLDGRKTQTRRIVKDQPQLCKGFPRAANDEWGIYLDRPHAGPYKHIGKCPYGKPGDLLWVRETWAPSVEPENHRYAREGFTYRADWNIHDDVDLRGFHWRPSIHMPRRASRLTLEITEVRVERLQEISEQDAKSEGAERLNCPDYRTAFYCIWHEIHGHAKGKSWNADPWVWVLSFRVHRCNIDTYLKGKTA